MTEAMTPVAVLFRKWQKLKAEWDAAAASGITDDENNAWCVLVFAAADAVLDAPSAGPADFLMKLFAQTFDGDHDIGDCPRGSEIWAEARTMIEVAA